MGQVKLRRLLIAIYLFASPFAIKCAADQTNPKLAPLFESLKKSVDIAEIQGIQNHIWSIWQILPVTAEKQQKTFGQGIQSLQTGSFKTAIIQFTAVIEAQPEFAEAWNRRATAFFMIGDFEASLQDIQTTLTLEPRHFGALSGLSRIFENTGDMQRAQTAETLLLKLMPHNIRIQERLNQLQKLTNPGQSI
jgi:tetratricopeptide (TPR) repeat protein